MFGKRLLSTVHIITDSQGSKRNTGRCKIQNNIKETADGVGRRETRNLNKLE